MKEKNELVRIFTGSEVLVLMLKGALEEIEIGSLIQNEFQSGMAAGIGGFAEYVDLYIQKSDLVNAQPLINEFNQTNN
ncbi:MAG: DUF2007 domain-containing protein [Prolixibacteraceae bacterium]